MYFISNYIFILDNHYHSEYEMPLIYHVII